MQVSVFTASAAWGAVVCCTNAFLVVLSACLGDLAVHGSVQMQPHRMVKAGVVGFGCLLLAHWGGKQFWAAFQARRRQQPAC